MPAPEPPAQRTWSAEEFNELVNKHARGPREATTAACLPSAQTEFWEVASDDEIAAWMDKHRRRQQRQ